MQKIEIIKTVTRFVVGAGTSKIVDGIVRNNTDAKNIYEKIAIGVAGIVAGAMAADAAKEYTDAQIDEIADWWNNRNSVKTEETPTEEPLTETTD